MSIGVDTLKDDLDRLTDEQLQAVADFIAFLKFRQQRDRRSIIDPLQMAALRDFALEDRNLDKTHLTTKLGQLQPKTIASLEDTSPAVQKKRSPQTLTYNQHPLK